jgi:hypothetical protein
LAAVLSLSLSFGLQLEAIGLNKFPKWPVYPFSHVNGCYLSLIVYVGYQKQILIP